MIGSLLGAGQDAFFVLEPCQRKVLHLSNGVMPGMGPVAEYSTNSRGIRGREFSPRDRVRLLALGCSVAISTFVDQSRTWTAILERILTERRGLKTWVGCVGKSEMTSRDVATVMRFFVPQFLGLIDALIVLVGVNDLALMLSKRSAYDPQYLDDAGLEVRFRRAFVRLPSRYEGRSFPANRWVWRVARCLKRHLVPQVFENSMAFYDQKRERRQRASEMLDFLPDIGPGLEEFARNIGTIADLAEAYSLRLIVLTQPSLWRPDLTDEEQQLLWFGWVGETSRFYSASALAEGIRLYNQKLMSVCHEREIECVDLASRLPKSTAAFYDDVHFNESGSRHVAESVAGYVTGTPATHCIRRDWGCG